MNSALNTTGILPLTVGSVYTFEHQGILNGLGWDLTGGSASLLMTAPDGSAYTYAASISGGNAFYTWTALNIPGTWVLAWSVTDADNRHQVSRPIVFEVMVSPGTPFLN